MPWSIGIPTVAMPAGPGPITVHLWGWWAIPGSPLRWGVEIQVVVYGVGGAGCALV
jgi:hypothetical protein